MREIKLERLYDRLTGRDRWVAWEGKTIIAEADTRAIALEIARGGK